MPTHLTDDTSIAGMPVNSHQSVYLARGLSNVQLQQLEGREVDFMTGAPTEQEAIDQVGENCFDGSLVEFTANRTIAEAFGNKGWVIVVKVRRMYLTRGSTVEAGWVAYKKAPFEIIEKTRGKNNKKKGLFGSLFG
ncbi:MAG: DUF4765 family protein [Myxococcales bacterium]|nr:DUF4765 family protein [Myxococcales bacterium]MCB9713488.1 DUF4765 family protein [Myxococcales bacterium]